MNRYIYHIYMALGGHIKFASSLRHPSDSCMARGGHIRFVFSLRFPSDSCIDRGYRPIFAMCLQLNPDWKFSVKRKRASWGSPGALCRNLNVKLGSINAKFRFTINSIPQTSIFCTSKLPIGPA